MIYKIENKFESYVEQEKVGPHSINFQGDQFTLSKNRLRLELDPGDVFSGGGCRAEVKFPRTKQYSEWWAGFRVMLDGKYKDNFLSAKDWLTIFQWHDQPDSGEMWRWPITSIQVKNGKFIVTSYFDEHPMSLGTNGRDTITRRPDTIVGDLVFDKWISFTMHTKWYWDSRGQLEVWMNGIRVFNLPSAAVCYNDKVGPFAKFGIYTSKEQKKPLVLYLSDIILMDGPDHFKDVDVLERLGGNVVPQPLTVEERLTRLEKKVFG